MKKQKTNKDDNEVKVKLVLKKKLAPNENFLAIETTTLIPDNIIIWPESRTLGQSESKLSQGNYDGSRVTKNH